MTSGFIIAQDNVKRRTNSIRFIVAKFPKLAAWPEIGRQHEKLSPRLRSWLSDNTSSFIVRWKMELKSFASCVAREICPRCLNKQTNATMEADPTKACNQDGTGFIRLNGLRLKVATEGACE